MRETAPKELPAKYYLDYFTYLLAFVKDKYGAILGERENEFLRRFTALSEEGRCLFVRMVNRRGQFFRANKLAYEEIISPDETLEELRQNGFISNFSERHEPEAADVLNLFIKPELAQFLPLLELNLKGISKYKKPELAAYLLENVPFVSLHEVVHASELIIRQEFNEEIEMLKFLFFGDLYSDMTGFVIRDVWDLRYEQYDDRKFTPRFLSRKEAEDKYFLSKIYLQFKIMRETLPAAEIFGWFCNWISEPKDWDSSARPVFDKLVLRLGTLLEKNQLTEQALKIYQHTQQPPSRERQIRLLHKLNRLPEAIILCEQLAGDARNADEKFFALDFKNRLEASLSRELKRKIRKSTTQQLHESETIRVPDTFKYQVEQGVIYYLSERNQRAVHTENSLWCSFFGLFLWDIIFDEDQQAIHHPLQRAPSDLYTTKFLEKRQTSLQKRLEDLYSREAFHLLIQRIHAEKYGMGNPLVGWHESLLELVLTCYDKLQPEQIERVLLEMARNLKENTRGFPDLFCWDENGYCFIEVKSPNDHLSAQQLHWLQFFKEIGIHAKALRVEWEIT